MSPSSLAASRHRGTHAARKGPAFAPRELFILVLPALLMLAIPGVVAVLCRAQDKPDRPPWAQKPKGEAAAKAPAAANEDAQDSGAQRGRIRVNVNLVNVLVSVLDEHNRPAPDLPREAFQLFDEGNEQKIDIFEPETSLPLDLALMIDASMSAHKEIMFEQEAAAHFIRQVVRPGDRLSVFAFDENVTQLAAFSDNVATLQSAVRRIPPGAGTSIYD